MEAFLFLVSVGLQQHLSQHQREWCLCSLRTLRSLRNLRGDHETAAHIDHSKMSSELPNTQPNVPVSKGRKQVTKKLSTGQRITLSLQDERTLRAIYEYLAGYASRRTVETVIEEKRADVSRLHTALPPSARLLLQMQPKNSVVHSTPEAEGERSEGDLLLDQYYKAKDALQKAEDKLKVLTSTDHKISFKDLDAILKSLGKPRPVLFFFVGTVDVRCACAVDGCSLGCYRPASPGALCPLPFPAPPTPRL